MNKFSWCYFGIYFTWHKCKNGTTTRGLILKAVKQRRYLKHNILYFTLLNRPFYLLPLNNWQLTQTSSQSWLRNDADNNNNNNSNTEESVYPRRCVILGQRSIGGVTVAKRPTVASRRGYEWTSTSRHTTWSIHVSTQLRSTRLWRMSCGCQCGIVYQWCWGNL